MREVVLDTETTGLDPLNGDRIVEIACLELLNNIPSGRHWHSYVNPECEVPAEAFQVHGLSSEFLKDKPVFAALAEELLGFIEGAQVVIHNAAFDVGFLNAELERIGRPPLPMDRIVDTLAVARRKHPGASNSLDALCRRYQIDASGRDKHGALIDCELLACVYAELTGRRQARLELASAGAEAAVAQAVAEALRARPEALPPRLTAEELAAHAAHVAALGEEALWRKYPLE